MLNPKQYIWTEKFRPKKVSEMVGSFKDKIMKYLDKQESIPHFLFHSKSPGCGKTTLAKCIINELDCDSLILNSSDDRKIDTVREKVKEFSITQSSKKGKRRCVFMDEFDGMQKIPQNALRNIMETYSSNVFFILTANNINKIIEPLQSRCVVLPFAYPDKEEIYKYLEKICKSESLDYTESGIKKLINLNYPNIRNCVISLQDLWTEGKPVTEETVNPVNELYEEMYKLLKDKNWKDIKKVVLQGTIDARELNTYFWHKAVEKENIKMIQVCCRNEKDIAWGAKDSIVFVTSLIELTR